MARISAAMPQQSCAKGLHHVETGNAPAQQTDPTASQPAAGQSTKSIGADAGSAKCGFLTSVQRCRHGPKLLRARQQDPGDVASASPTRMGVTHGSSQSMKHTHHLGDELRESRPERASADVSCEASVHLSATAASATRHASFDRLMRADARVASCRVSEAQRLMDAR